MSRRERRAATKTKVAGVYPVKPEHFSKKTGNGLMQVAVVFGMVRNPNGEREVRDAFRDVAAAMRELADHIDRINENASIFSRGGDA